MKKLPFLWILTLGLLSLACDDDLATTGTLVVKSGPFNKVVGLYDPASVTPNGVNTLDAIYIQSYKSSGEATFSNILPGNYIVVFHENFFVRRGVQVIAGEIVTIAL